ncbi:hypothetical protein [Tsukamurella ocularis]|uniref:hypothetical protein n=1 Tax=Tsukamurella ocularis TaxID=1970234 RepID=UPI002168662B|nr:hypothetical protein [Tsukamurella ocularis]MCS3853291.1 hypothetical protein [Tsukamurella ocularis]
MTISAGTYATDPLPIMNRAQLAAAVAERGPIEEVLACKDKSLVFVCGERYSRFVLTREQVDLPPTLDVPHVMLRLADAGWVGLDPGVATVGYVGTGPTETVATLEQAGLAREVAETVAHRSATRLWFDAAGAVVDEQHEEAFSLACQLRTLPEPLDSAGRRFRVPLGLDTARNVGGDEENQEVYRWLDYLDSPPPWLAHEPRCGSLYTTREAAEDDGFAEPTAKLRVQLAMGGIPPWKIGGAQLVIEQGPVQLWVTIRERHDDPAVWVPPGVRHLLEYAGLTPDRIAAGDDAPRWRKILTGRAGKRPALIGLGDYAQLPPR